MHLNIFLRPMALLQRISNLDQWITKSGSSGMENILHTISNNLVYWIHKRQAIERHQWRWPRAYRGGRQKQDQFKGCNFCSGHGHIHGALQRKDGNIFQAMSQAQAHAIDAWSYFQANSIKQMIAENSLKLFKIQNSVANIQVEKDFWRWDQSIWKRKGRDKKTSWRLSKGVRWLTCTSSTWRMRC